MGSGDGARARRYADEASERLGLPILLDGAEGVVPRASAGTPAQERRSASDTPVLPFSETLPPPGLVLEYEGRAWRA